MAGVASMPTHPTEMNMRHGQSNDALLREPSLDSTTKNGIVLEESRFDATKHLHADHPEVMTMEDIGYARDTGVSPIAVSAPFKLFTEDAVSQMRKEVFYVRDHHPEHTYESNIAPCQLRGYVPKLAPFTREAWTHPSTLQKISEIAGLEIVPWSSYEIAHVNMSTKSHHQVQVELAELESKKRAHAEDEGIGGCPHEDDKPIVGWHKDSYPFVCVLMLSDCSSMVGGETALLKGNGEVTKVRGPEMGCAVVLQGRYITHQALRALGATERITAVTSFRPKCPLVRDDSVLTTVRPISDLSQLYFDFAEYRMEMIVARFNNALKQLRSNNKARKSTDVATLRSFLEESEEFLAHTRREIIPYDMVEAGVLPEENVPEFAARTDVAGPSASGGGGKRLRTK